MDRPHDERPPLRLSEASRLAGVDVATMRRWADEGKVDTFRTPGGHRRFVQQSVESLVEARPRDPYPRERLSEAADLISNDVHRRIRRGDARMPPWQTRLTAEQRDEFRHLGHETFNLVIRVVAAAKRPERTARMTEAQRTGALYGAAASAAGLTLAEAVEAFLYFRFPVLEALQNHLRRRSADPRTVAAVFREANAAIDEVLVSLIASHRETTPSADGGV
jgi:hypothetical protein